MSNKLRTVVSCFQNNLSRRSCIKFALNLQINNLKAPNKIQYFYHMRNPQQYSSLELKPSKKTHSHKLPFSFRKFLQTQRQQTQSKSQLPQLLVPHQRSMLLISQKRKNDVDKMKVSRRYSQKKVEIVFKKDDNLQKKYESIKSDDRQKLKKIKQLEKMILKTQQSKQKSPIGKKYSLKYEKSPQRLISELNSTKYDHSKVQPIIIRSRALKTKDLMDKRTRLLKEMIRNKIK